MVTCGFGGTDKTVLDVVDNVSPSVLLQAWRDVVDPVPSDLTDAEWELIEPFFPARDPNGVRIAVNGMLYRFSSGCSWFGIPPKYGAGHPNIYFRQRRYERDGVFTRILNELRDAPQAERLIVWLRSQALS